MLQYAAANAKQFQTQYGNISAASVGAMQRGLLALEQQGGDKFLGEPALNLDDLMQTDARGMAWSISWPRTNSSTRPSSMPLSVVAAERALRAPAGGG